MTSNEIQTLSLTDFITTNTINLLTKLKISPSFLSYPVDKWSQIEDYQKGREVISKLRVVNDCAERAIALASTYNNCLSTDDEQKQFIMHIISENRVNLPNVNKKTLSEHFQQNCTINDESLQTIE